MTNAASEQFSFRQRILLAIVPRLVWILLSIAGRTWRFEIIAEECATPLPFGGTRRKSSASGINAFCPARSISAAPARHHRQPELRRRMITRTLESLDTKPCAAPARAAHRRRCSASSRVIDPAASNLHRRRPAWPDFSHQVGPIKLAALTGARIGAFHLQPRHAWSLHSWDRFLVPMPFTRICCQLVSLDNDPCRSRRRRFRIQREQLNAALERARLRAWALRKSIADASKVSSTDRTEGRRL